MKKSTEMIIGIPLAIVLTAVKLVVMYFTAIFVLLIGLLVINELLSQVEVNTDISRYNDYIGENAKEHYQVKLFKEEIFPEHITEDMDVSDYKMVYYNPWDPQYLSYLVVDYTDEGYDAEIERLKSCETTDYIGCYGVTGFTKYDLVAMYADGYNGFVYAMTDGQCRIIYVEIMFCNYFMDLDYEDYIDTDYLPDGFDATKDNPYKEEMFKKQFQSQ